MKKILLFLLCFYQTTCLLSQIKPNQIEKGTTKKRHQFRIALGVGLGDGLIFLPNNFVPTFSIGYEYCLSNRFSFASHVLTYYSSYLNLTNNFNTNAPYLSRFRGSASPFFSQTEKDKLNASGIFPIHSLQYLKKLSVPLDVGFTFYPLNKKHHQIGINAALTMTYNSYNWYPDSFTGVLTLKDGTTKAITLEVPTEFRDFSLGFSPKLFYAYSFEDYSLGIRAANYNVFFANRYAVPIWETSLFWGLKF